MAFVFGRIEDPLLGYQRLYDVPLEWVASRRCVGVPERITPRGIARFPVLTDAPDSPLHRAVVGWFRAAKVTPRRIDICSGPTSRLNLALGGDWLTVVPTTILPAYSHGAEFTRHDCDPPLEPMEMGVAFRQVSQVGETLQHVLAIAPEVIAQWTRMGRRINYA
jgi:DNA-binding transcriptional LysR family regulator